MNRYTIYCTEAQTKKALELSAPIEPQTSSTLIDTLCVFCGDGMYIIPTAEQMIGWLEKQGCKIEIILSDEEEHPRTFAINKVKDVCVYDSRKEATLASIDAALDYLRIYV